MRQPTFMTKQPRRTKDGKAFGARSRAARTCSSRLLGDGTSRRHEPTYCLLHSGVQAELGHDAGHGHGEGTVNGAAAGAVVAATAKILGHLGHVHISLAAQADAVAVVGEF